MGWFLSGLVLFMGIHVITVTPALRTRVAGRLAADPWRGIVALLSVSGIVLICTGWSSVQVLPLFAPVGLVARAAPVLVSLALVLFVIGGAGLKGHIRRRLHHPMLIGVALWSATHLLANGGLRETILFGGFLAFAIYALGVLFRIGKRATFEPSLRADVIGIAIGLFVAVGVMHSHRLLFGVAVG